MKQNGLKLWQMIVMIVLLVGLLSTMFIPVLHFNKKVYKNLVNISIDAMESVVKGSDLYKKAESYEKEEFDDIIVNAKKELKDSDTIDESFEDIMEDYEKNGKTPSSLSTNFANIMFTDFYRAMVKLDNPGATEKETQKLVKKYKKEVNDAKKKLKDNEKASKNDKLSKSEVADLKVNIGIVNKYNLLRTVLILFYCLVFIALILTVVSFALKWSKWIMASANLAISAIGMGMFGYLRFGFWSSVCSGMKSTLDDLLSDSMDMWSYIEWLTEDMNLSQEEIRQIVLDMLSQLNAPGTVIAFVLSCLLLVICIVTMVIKNKEAQFAFAGVDDNPFAGGMPGMDGIDGMGAPAFGMENQEFAPSVEYNVGQTVGTSPEALNPFADTPEIPVTASDVPQFSPSPEMTQDMFQMPQQPVQPAQPAPMAPKVGKVLCTKGVAMGQGFQLPENRKVVIGKSATKANLIINYPKVSNVHCSIHYVAATDSYMVCDHSTNGTYVAGSRLPKEQTIPVPAGAILVLADGANEITLG